MTSVAAIACALPETEVTNSDLDREHPAWGMELIAELSGVHARRVAADEETALDLSIQACDDLLAGDVAVDDIDAILYCTNDPDYRMPGNAHLLHAHLGLDDRVLALDYNLACSGFVYGLALADALTSAGMASGTLLVTAETQSKRMNARDRSLQVLLGDGAAVTYVSADATGGGRIVASDLCTHGRLFRHAFIPAGGARNPATDETAREAVDSSGNVRSAEDLHMDGADVWAFLNSTVPSHVEGFLAKRSLTLDDIDLFVFHQGSKLILDSLTKALSIPPAKVVARLAEIGNLSSASIPFALRAAIDDGRVGPGTRVLLCGYGAGISYGSAILEF